MESEKSPTTIPSLSLSVQIKGGDPRVIKARMIADRLKAIGDEVEDEYNKSKLDDLIMLVMYTQTLSWRKVAELFKRLYRVMETIQYDDQVPLFEKVWGCLLDSVVPWIQDKGGWVSPYSNWVVILWSSQGLG